MQGKLKEELRRLASSQLVGKISRQLNEYERSLKKLAKEFEVKSRDARKKSRTHLDGFASQLKRTRGDVEKKVVTLLNHEGKRLNEGVGQVFNYLKTMAKNEKLAHKAGSPRKRAPKARPSESSTTTKKRTSRVKKTKGNA
jgi:hypothetical protein